jgi:hypothetical protein
MTPIGIAETKPWHLFTEEERRLATGMMVLCSSENPRAGNTPPPEPWFQDVNDAMLSVLREAAPYPDEALVFATPDGRHHEAMGLNVFRGTRYMNVEDRKRIRSVVGLEKLTPLTIGAVEFLDMAKRGLL